MNFLFYDPKRDNKLMGMSTDKNAMEFPYIETDQPQHTLDNLYLDDKKDVRFKQGTLVAEEVGRIIESKKTFTLGDIIGELKSGKIDEKRAISDIAERIQNL